MISNDLIACGTLLGVGFGLAAVRALPVKTNSLGLPSFKSSIKVQTVRVTFNQFSVLAFIQP